MLILSDNLLNNNKFSFNLDSFYKYLDSLSLLEESALFHIFILSFILLTLVSLISTLFANELINLFNQLKLVILAQ